MEKKCALLENEECILNIPYCPIVNSGLRYCSYSNKSGNGDIGVVKKQVKQLG